MILSSYFLLYIVKQTYRTHLIKRLWRVIKPFLTWRILVCYLPFWFMATGWAWLFSIIGKGALRIVALTWLGILWLPFCPEKLITIPCAIWLHKKLFPNHSVPKELLEDLEKERKKGHKHEK